jgi:iron complex transport system permease protein
MTGRASFLTLRRLAFWLTILSIAVIGAGLLSIALGSTWIPPNEVFSALFNGGGLTGTIIQEVRLPRVLLAGIVGAALAVAGVVFQALLRNALADPFLLGISGGAGLGAAIATAIGANFTIGGLSGMPLFAFAGAMCAILLVYLFSRAGGGLNLHAMLLAGVVVNSICASAILGLTVMLSQENLQRMTFWMMGHLSSMEMDRIAHLAIYVLIGMVILFSVARELNQMSLGESQAAFLGTNVELTKILSFVGASLITGGAVAASGIIGFVGLIVPHAMRFIVGPDHRILMPASMLGGAAFLMLADALARTVFAPTELPVGVITALVGGPAFLALLVKRTRG